MGLDSTGHDLSFWHQQGIKLLEYAPLALTYLNTHPGGWLDRKLTTLLDNEPGNWIEKKLSTYANRLFRQGAKYFPHVSEDMKAEIAAKSVRRIEPLAAPKAYYDAVRDPLMPATPEIDVFYIGETEPTTLYLHKYTDDRDTGFRGAIYRDGNGHSIVFMCGMSMSNGCAMRVFEAIVQAKMMKHGVNQHIAPAQELFLDGLTEDTTREVIVYSGAAIPGNDLGARLGAQVTAFADIGLPNRHNLYTSEHIGSVEENVLSLWLDSDEFTEKAGHVYGTIIKLPAVTGAEVKAQLDRKEMFNERSVIVTHDPKAYVIAAEKALEALRREQASPFAAASRTRDTWQRLEEWLQMPDESGAPHSVAA